MERTIADLDRIYINGGKRGFLVGITPLKSLKMAEYMHHDVPGVFVPEPLRKRLADAGDGAEEEGVQIALELIEAMKQKEGVNGIHLMPVGFAEEHDGARAPCDRRKRQREQHGDDQEGDRVDRRHPDEQPGHEPREGDRGHRADRDTRRGQREQERPHHHGDETRPRPGEQGGSHDQDEPRVPEKTHTNHR